jgi:hypothetical protein
VAPFRRYRARVHDDALVLIGRPIRNDNRFVAFGCKRDGKMLGMNRHTLAAKLHETRCDGPACFGTQMRHGHARRARVARGPQRGHKAIGPWWRPAATLRILGADAPPTKLSSMGVHLRSFEP